MKKRIYTIFFVLLLLLGGCGKPEANETVRTDKIQEATGEETKTEAAAGTALEEEAANGEGEDTLSLVMVGDVLLHDPVNESGRQADGTYNYDHLFAQVQDRVQAADLAIVNQEVILGGTELGLSGYPAFNGAYEVGDAIWKAGFQVVLHGTNHALDKGKKGILNCLNYWKSAHSDVAVLGIYENQEDYDRNFYIYEENDMKIAILNYTYGTNGISLPADMPYAVSLLEEEKVKQDLAQAEEAADFTIVCPHWGTEYSHDISAEQERWAKWMVENGADLILGTHPHVIEPVEWVESTSGKKGLVYYSLGNFVNATSGSGAGITDRMVGAMAKVTLARGEDGQVGIQSYGVEPLITHLRYGTGQITTYLLADYTQELAEENETKEKDPAFSLEYCKNLCRQVFGNLYEEE